MPLLLFDASVPPLRISVTHFALLCYERTLRLPTSFPISGLARLGMKPDSPYRPGELLHPLTCSCFLFTSSREGFFCLPSRFSLERVLMVRLSPTLTLSRLTDLVLWTDSSVPFPFGKDGSGVLANGSLWYRGHSFFFQQAQYAQVSLLKSATSHLLLYYLRSVLTTLSSPLFFLLGQTLCQIWQELVFSPCSIRLQWVPGHWFLPVNDAADEMARLGVLLAPSIIPCSL